ncbi:hypothetical protein DC522_29905 [Microvirga sp. KLBC 81]|nr:MULTISPECIES: hypothetical protein [Microvirga]PVE20862.1 hypothetical protein DC522_29905 [Microvirga sp. KLBC 81]
MDEWQTVFEDEIEGRLVTVQVYQSYEAADGNEDEGPPVRVTTTSVDDYPGVLEEEDGDNSDFKRDGSGASITLEPCSLDDLEGELMEVGFSPEAATTIASKIPV